MTLATHPLVVRSGVDARLLRQSQIFAALDDGALGEKISSAHSRTIPGGILLSETADFSNFIFVVERGRIHCYRLSQSGSPVTLCVVSGIEANSFMEPERVVTPGAHIDDIWDGCRDPSSARIFRPSPKRSSIVFREMGS